MAEDPSKRLTAPSEGALESEKLGTGYGRSSPFRTTIVGADAVAHTPSPGEPGYGQGRRQDIASAIEQSARFADKNILTEGPSKPDFWTFGDKAMLGLCELLALLFGLPFGEDLYNERPITNWHLFYLAVGLLFAVTGPIWPLIRTRTWLPASIATSLSKTPLDARFWIAALLLLFFYGTAPEMYQRATTPTAPPIVIHDLPTAEDIAKATAPIRAERDAAIKERDAAKKELQDAKGGLPTLSPLGVPTLSTNTPLNVPPLTASPSLTIIPTLQTEKEKQLQAELEEKTKELEQAQNSRPPYRQKMGPISTLNAFAATGAIWRELMPLNDAILLTAKSENQEVQRDLASIFTVGMREIQNQIAPGKSPFLSPPNYQRDIDAPRLNETDISGVIIHGDAPEQLRHFLEHCFVVRYSTKIPDGLVDFYKFHRVIWIEIGKGSPWKGNVDCAE